MIQPYGEAGEYPGIVTQAGIQCDSIFLFFIFFLERYLLTR